jgi:hypothetical protein
MTINEKDRETLQIFLPGPIFYPWDMTKLDYLSEIG